MQKFLRLLRILAALPAFASPCLEAASFEFSDGVFDDANWSTATLIDTTPGRLFAVAAGQATAGGNPADYRMLVHESSSPGTAAVLLLSGHYYLPRTFEPARDGAIESLDVRFDGISFDSTAGAMGYALLVRQAGADYVAYGGPTLNGEGWQRFAMTGLTADAFGLVTSSGFDDSRRPDFSPTGSSITLGFAALNGTFGVSTNKGGIDNWHVSIRTATPVPIPSAALLLVTGVMALPWWRRQRR